MFLYYSITGQKWEFSKFCFKKMLLQFHRAYLNCIWILCSTPPRLFMVFIEYSHYSLPLCTFINTTSERHPLRFMIYNCKQDVTSHASTNITEPCKVSLAYSERARESLSFNTGAPMLIRPQPLDFSKRLPVHRLSLCTCIPCLS